MAKNFYEILGVSKTASADEIKSSYKKLAKKYHPDLNPGNKEAEAKFKEISAAYDTLSDSKKRAEYDNPSPFGQGGFGGGGGGGFSGFGGFDDLFNMFNGGAGGGGGSPANRKGEDINLTITLTFEEAAFGCNKDITVTRYEHCSACDATGAKGGTAYSNCSTCNGTGTQRVTQDTLFGRMASTRTCPDCRGTGKNIKETCPDCGGRGVQRKTRALKVPFPPGVEPGALFSLPGEGNQARGAAHAGDVLLSVNVIPHKLFKRRNKDLYLSISITFTQAILGAKIMVPTLKSPVPVTIPESFQSGTSIVLKGLGIEHANKRGTFGDLIITVDVEMPKNLSRDQKDALNRLSLNIKKDQYNKAKDYYEQK